MKLLRVEPTAQEGRYLLHVMLTESEQVEYTLLKQKLNREEYEFLMGSLAETK